MERKQGYKQRCTKQMNDWVLGNPIHNKIDDECCPDFSCCQPKLLADEKTRKAFKSVHDQGGDVMPFLASFLGGGIAEMGSDVYISGSVADNPE